MGADTLHNMLFTIVAILVAIALLGLMAYAHSRRDHATKTQREQARAAYLRDIENDQALSNSKT